MYFGLGCGGPHKEEHLHATHAVRNHSSKRGENAQGKRAARSLAGGRLSEQPNP